MAKRHHCHTKYNELMVHNSWELMRGDDANTHKHAHHHFDENFASVHLILCSCAKAINRLNRCRAICVWHWLFDLNLFWSLFEWYFMFYFDISLIIYLFFFKSYITIQERKKSRDKIYIEWFVSLTLLGNVINNIALQWCNLLHSSKMIYANKCMKK